MLPPFDYSKELHFLNIAQKLKMELRHCWYENGRRESVAEHSWRLALMAIRFAPYLNQPIDLLKALKIALIHDLPEALVGDIPITQQSPDTKHLKAQAELHAMQQITNSLNDPSASELLNLYLEFENSSSYEAKFIHALDKLEAWIQHNEAPLHTWELKEKQMVFQSQWLKDHCTFDPFLSSLADNVIASSTQKLLQAGENLLALQSKT